MSEVIDAGSPMDDAVATGFGGGLGKNGLVCGAVAGAVMIIGLQGKGRGKPVIYQRVDSFLTRFKTRFGAVNCRELLGVDLKTEDGMQYLKTEGRKRCREFVRYAAETVSEMIRPDR